MLSRVYFTLNTPEENRILLEGPPVTNVFVTSRVWPTKRLWKKEKGKKCGIEVVPDKEVAKQSSNYYYYYYYCCCHFLSPLIKLLQS